MLRRRHVGLLCQPCLAHWERRGSHLRGRSVGSCVFNCFNCSWEDSSLLRAFYTVAVWASVDGASWVLSPTLYYCGVGFLMAMGSCPRAAPTCADVRGQQPPSSCAVSSLRISCVYMAFNLASSRPFGLIFHKSSWSPQKKGDRRQALALHFGHWQTVAITGQVGELQFL